jgi:hypothetical protein
MAVHIHPVDLPIRFYKPIGQLVAGWNLTEALVCSIAWHFHKIKSPPVGRLLIYRHNSVEKLNILLVTAQRFVSEPARQGTLCRLYGEANKIRKARNKIAHGLWGRMPNERSKWKVFYPREENKKDKTLMQRDLITLQDLTDLASRVRKLNKDIKKFMAANKIPPP